MRIDCFLEAPGRKKYNLLPTLKYETLPDTNAAYLGLSFAIDWIEDKLNEFKQGTVRRRVTTPDRFIDALNDRFSGVLRWQKLLELWDVVLRKANADWYIYAIVEPLHHSPCSAADIERFTAAIDGLRKHDLRDDSCKPIVHADICENPQLLRIYEPFHRGSACRHGAAAPRPGWILNRAPPTELKTDRVLTDNRRRWWREIWQQAPAVQYVLNG